AELATKRGLVRLTQTTDYPWEGDIEIEVAPDGPAAWTLMLRIPGSSLGRPLPGGLYSYLDAAPGTPSIKVNGRETAAVLDKGYWAVRRTWARGDVVTLSLPMPVRLVRARGEVAADAGRIAVERGPLVYAAEAVDNGGTVSNLLFDPSVLPAPEFRPGLLRGLTVLAGKATAFRMKNGKEDAVPGVLTLIPYYAWAHRDAGGMAVWLAAEKDKIRPSGGGAESEI
ncbi:MAG TPA: glycoside hydrolase family 127 protein, partial [Candidatus Aminicenantes bacterium]|nr:glycoside hydrolase family 127 protein [Candidatus Aminicenantes bacterium]